MARLNITVPDDLAAAARAAHLNVSQVAQDALRIALRRHEMQLWLADVGPLDDRPGPTGEQIRTALDEARAELLGA
jgi:hypothetical protein